MRKYAYIIMPVQSDLSYPVRRAAIESALDELGMEGHFPLDVVTIEGEFDLQQTLGEFEGATLVIADLSLQRPSCYYELGLAQALGRTTLLIAEEGTDVHQAFGRNGVLFYKSPADLTSHLVEAVRGVLS